MTLNIIEWGSERYCTKCGEPVVICLPVLYEEWDGLCEACRIEKLEREEIEKDQP